MSYQIDCLVDSRDGTGESPVWDAAHNRLFWVDIPGQKVHMLAVDSGATRTWTMPKVIGCLALFEENTLAVGLKDGVYRFDLETEALTLIAGIETDKPDNRVNDGKVGPDGAFWVGTMDDLNMPKLPLAALYRVTADGKVEKKVSDLKVSNGLAWSADKRTMFHSDSRGPWVDRYDFDATTGGMTNRTRILELTEAEGRPDGGACDIEGNYWSGGISAGVINKFSRDGTLLEKIPLPFPTPTMPCFGGPDMKTLYITSARGGQSDEVLAKAPQTGGLFAMRVSVAGAPVARFGKPL